MGVTPGQAQSEVDRDALIPDSLEHTCQSWAVSTRYFKSVLLRCRCRPAYSGKYFFPSPFHRHSFCRRSQSRLSRIHRAIVLRTRCDKTMIPAVCEGTLMTMGCIFRRFAPNIRIFPCALETKPARRRETVNNVLLCVTLRGRK